VPASKEPHHHLVFENEHVRVLRVSIPGHDATLLHQHDVPYVYVSLGPASVINAVAGKPEATLVMADGQVGYSPGHFAHIARTDAGSSFDNVTIELLKPQGEPKNLCAQIVQGAASGGCDKRFVSTRKGQGFSVEPQMETAEIKLDLISLGPKTKRATLALQADSLLVALNKSEVKIEVKGKPAKTLRSGEVAWIEASSHATVSNPSRKPSSYLQLSFKDSGGSAKP
jgi:hypothetical protein